MSYLGTKRNKQELSGYLGHTAPEVNEDRGRGRCGSHPTPTPCPLPPPYTIRCSSDSRLCLVQIASWEKYSRPGQPPFPTHTPTSRILPPPTHTHTENSSQPPPHRACAPGGWCRVNVLTCTYSRSVSGKRVDLPAARRFRLLPLSKCHVWRTRCITDVNQSTWRVRGGIATILDTRDLCWEDGLGLGTPFWRQRR